MFCLPVSTLRMKNSDGKCFTCFQGVCSNKKDPSLSLPVVNIDLSEDGSAGKKDEPAGESEGSKDEENQDTELDELRCGLFEPYLTSWIFQSQTLGSSTDRTVLTGLVRKSLNTVLWLRS